MPLRADLADAAVAGIECHPTRDGVDRVRIYWFDIQQDLLDSYFARLAGEGVESSTTDSGRCNRRRASEGPYVPSPPDVGLDVPERGGCYVDEARQAHYVVTKPPFVLIELDGTSDDTKAVERWAWLGNQDQPGGPTIWREFPIHPNE